MNNLTIINNNGTQVIDSREVAEMVGKRHSDLIRGIKKICDTNKTINDPNLGLVDFFIESTYQDNKGETRPRYLFTKAGLKLYLSHSRGITPQQYKILGVDDMDIVYSYTRFETAFLDMLEKALDTLGIKGHRQYNVDGKYRIDFYIPSKNIAVEYDESQHKYHHTEDERRESYIKEKLGCKFVRCDYQDEDIVNVMRVVKEVI